MAKGQKQEQKNPEEQRQNLQRGSSEIKALSARLDECLKRAEAWFASLEGKVETMVQIDDPHPHSGDIAEFVFQLRLAKPAWILEARWEVVEHYRSAAYQSPNWQPVSSGSMDTKIATVHAIPVLYAAIQDSQAAYLNKLREANLKFDEFARAVGAVGEDA